MLFFETLRIAKMTKCKYIIQENVKGVATIENGDVMK